MKNPQRPAGDETNRVVYTGTHDNDTTVGWWQSASRTERANVERACAAMGIDEDEPHWALIRLALASPAWLSLIPAQDLLGLGSEARMNTPGKAEGNWSWRLRRGQLTDELADRVRELTIAAGRRSTSSSNRLVDQAA
jgi:4-alpha-glucanotransferase